MKHLQFRWAILLRTFTSRMSIRMRFLIVFIVTIAVISASVAAMAFYTATHIVEKQTRDMSLQLVQKIAEIIDYRTAEIQAMAVELSNLPDVRRMAQENVSEQDAQLQQIAMSRVMESVAFSHPEVKYVCMMGAQGGMSWWASSTSKEASKELNRNYVRTIFESSYYRGVQEPTGQAWVASHSGNEALLISLIRDTHSPDNTLGAIVVGVDTRFFRATDASDVIIKSDSLAMIDEDNDVIAYGAFSNRQLLDAMQASPGKRGSLETSFYEYQGEKYLLSKVETTRRHWTVLCFLPVKDLLSGTNTFKNMVIGVCIVALIVGVILAYVLSSAITRNIKRLEQSMRQVEDGNLRVRVRPERYDEVGELALRFNYMISRLNTLINSEYKARIEKQRAEYAALEARFNPHFLYNTLGSIRWMAHNRKQPEIETMTRALIELLRTSVKKQSEFHTLRDELNYVRNYLTLQQIRYENSFSVAFEAEEELQDGWLLNFILQPLVENAIFHGIEISQGNGNIRIAARRDDGMLLLEVTDNGVGMDEATLAGLLTHDREEGHHTGLNSLGVHLVHQRIRMHHGEPFGLVYASAPGQGTTVRIQLPWMEVKPDELPGDDCG